ncbi:MAG: MFS transporter [Gammaproteobacteria bacterium]|nr:MFS transporter [Gammaproteobacteria bacterium]
MTKPSRMPLTIYLLSMCNGFLYISQSLLITISALIGFELAPEKTLATVPMALQFFAIMASSMPASWFMGRFGRRLGFIFANCIGVIGSTLALYALFTDSFHIFCAATVCFGIFAAFGNYYRFTAAEVVDESNKSLAISFVMAGGVVAGFIGPNLANWSSSIFAAERFAGPFAVLIVVYIISMITISRADLPKALKKDPSNLGRPISDIMRQPIFIVAVACQMFGYGTMNFVMSATPLAMHAHEFGMSPTALVIQWHVVSMFAPSFVTGHLIKRLGILPVLAIGVLLGFACVAINLSGQSLPHFVSSLILLGISWNFLYVGGTTLLTDAYEPQEKAKTQAINDFIVFTTVTVTAMSAGGMHHIFGWQVVNISVIPMLLVTALAISWLFLLRRNVQLAHKTVG